MIVAPVLLEGTVATILRMRGFANDLTDYALQPVVGEASRNGNRILGMLAWMVDEG